MRRSAFSMLLFACLAAVPAQAGQLRAQLQIEQVIANVSEPGSTGVSLFQDVPNFTFDIVWPGQITPYTLITGPGELRSAYLRTNERRDYPGFEQVDRVRLTLGGPIVLNPIGSGTFVNATAAPIVARATYSCRATLGQGPSACNGAPVTPFGYSRTRRTTIDATGTVPVGGFEIRGLFLSATGITIDWTFGSGGAGSASLAGQLVGFTFENVPEPAAAWLVVAGAGALWWIRRRR